MPKEGYYLPSRKLVSQNEAAIIQRPQIPRSKFIGAWTRKTTFDAGYLVPFMLDEILPGDHMSYDVTAYIRMSTPLFPLMDNQRIDTFFFFVPARLTWANWNRFMGEQANPSDSIALTIPTVSSDANGFAVGSIYDHFGLPCVGQVTPTYTVTVNALPFRAYNQIWNQWFRDENVMNSAAILTGDGPDGNSNYALLRRAKSHDYFTSALPWPQKFTAPNVPLSGLAPIQGLAINKLDGGGGPRDVYETARGGGTSQTTYPSSTFEAATMDQHILVEQHTITGWPMVYADLAQATGASINTFRQAFLVQQLLEQDARGGTRYTELIKSHFGVTNPDFRLQRPEYIGGGQTPLILTPVAQTAPTAGVPLGAIGAAGTATGQHRASYAATEHGYIIGLINVRTELSYQQGIHRMWTRSTRYDFYWPALAGLGEQAILRREIYATGVPTDDTAVFGYQERWHEYRTRTSEVTNLFNSTHAGNNDAWHLSQEFSSAPTLNATFLEDRPPMTRVLAAAALADGQQYLADILIQRSAVRPIPTYGTPVTLGRF